MLFLFILNNRNLCEMILLNLVLLDNAHKPKGIQRRGVIIKGKRQLVNNHRRLVRM